MPHPPDPADNYAAIVDVSGVIQETAQSQVTRAEQQQDHSGKKYPPFTVTGYRKYVWKYIPSQNADTYYDYH